MTATNIIPLRAQQGAKRRAETRPGAFVNLFMMPRGEVQIQRTSKARPATALTLYAALPMHRLADVKRLFARDPQNAPHGLRVIEAAPYLHAHGHIPRDKAQLIRSIYKARIEETLAATPKPAPPVSQARPRARSVSEDATERSEGEQAK